jgi:hypothetical protein
MSTLRMTSSSRRSAGVGAFVLSTLALCTVWRGSSRADYVGNKYTDATTGQVLQYNVFVPTGYDATKKYPLLVFLHAANTNQIPPPRTLASDGVGWTGSFINTPHQATDPSFFMIPISQTNMSGWGEATDPISTPEKFEGELTIKVMKSDVMTKYNIDPTRLYITGPSMGGRGTWDILRRYPGLFAAAAPAAAPASPTDAALFLNENIWAICGQVDPIVQGERDTITAIRKLGGNPIYTELAGHGHDSWRWVYPDPQFVPWMYAQRLGVPWWTVSKPPVAPFTGGTPQATLSPDWPVTMPPANLSNSFGGAPGGAGTSAPPGGGAAGGMTGAVGTPPSAGASGTSAGVAGAPGPTGGGPSSGSPGSSGGAPVLAGSTGGSPVAVASSGGAPGSGGAPSVSTPTSAASGGAGAVPAGHTGGASGASDTGGQGGGCSYARGRGGVVSLLGTFGLIVAFALRRRRRIRGGAHLRRPR